MDKLSQSEHELMNEIYKWACADIRKGVEIDGKTATHISDVRVEFSGGGSTLEWIDADMLEYIGQGESKKGGDTDIVKLLPKGVAYCETFFGYVADKVVKRENKSRKKVDAITFKQLALYQPYLDRLAAGEGFFKVQADFEKALVADGNHPNSVAAYKANLTRRWNAIK